ncbi:hypothetical protein ANCCAN_10935 [Ancylostoma caninum]|uniref:Uncharacterized protein n=1 Tax=Ancylostoma caninum TaxID=29170 RepID=A0A368GFF4_ANCCA|nr:hypothetical protein ANCCAN_10935 [Ancylostoma caninum]
MSNRIPEAVSKYIIEYYMRHSDVLLNNTTGRTLMANTRRTNAIRRLSADLWHLFGYEASAKKIKNHFDHYRSKTLFKGYAVNYVASRGERRPSKTYGLRPSLTGTTVPKDPFKNPAEEVVWNYYEGTSVGGSNRGSEVGDPGHPHEFSNVLEMEEHNSHNNGPVKLERDNDHLVHGRVDHRMNSSDQGRHSEVALDDIVLDSEECSDSRSEAAPSPSNQCSSHTCQAGADLLKEMRSLFQEQRHFFREMSHMMQEVCSLVQLTKEQILEKSPSNINSTAPRTLSSNDDVREVKAASLL